MIARRHDLVAPSRSCSSARAARRLAVAGCRRRTLRPSPSEVARSATDDAADRRTPGPRRCHRRPGRPGIAGIRGALGHLDARRRRERQPVAPLERAAGHLDPVGRPAHHPAGRWIAIGRWLADLAAADDSTGGNARRLGGREADGSAAGLGPAGAASGRPLGPGRAALPGRRPRRRRDLLERARGSVVRRPSGKAAGSASPGCEVTRPDGRVTRSLLREPGLPAGLPGQAVGTADDGPKIETCASSGSMTPKTFWRARVWTQALQLSK